MEIAKGTLSSVITKLGVLLTEEYKPLRGVKGEIRFLQSELESMKGALEKVSNTPPDQLDIQDKIWVRDLRELSYDIEDYIDTFMVRVKGDKSAKRPSFKNLVHKSLIKNVRIRHRLATDIRGIKSRIAEVQERRLRYDVNNGVAKPTIATVDPRLFAQYTEAKELVGIGHSSDELIKVLMDGNRFPLQQGKIVSIVGFGGLGKTTLAKHVYEKIRGLFDCCAFVSVSQTPDLHKLFMAILYQLDWNKYDDSFFNETFLDEQGLINELREFLGHKRYFVVLDDLWDISVWKMIRCALPDNDVGYKIITTTRILDVAHQVGGAYKLKPLSHNDCRKLLYIRIFGNENKDNIDGIEKCPDEDLAEVSERILQKCGGVPLAIVTMASLLASKARNKIDWYDVYNSIGTGLQNSDLEDMRKILSLSYYAMPSHLRICLLYLSMFPEDYKIEKDCLIWMWIAEGFIQCENQGKSLFAIGESYFNELINRSMIQPIYDECTGLIYSCQVHDMMHDLICSLSSEENFVSILNTGYDTSASKIFRRLSLQYGKDDNAMPQHTTSMQRVRSAIVFPSAFCVMPVLTKFNLLRVLNLQDCDISRGYSLEYLENLFYLRYLGLCGTHISQLPEEIGNLEFLQTLDVRGNNMFSLPSTIVQLTNLMCLYIDEFTRVPNGIGSLTNLEVLSTLDITVSMDIIEELGQLMELRVLHILLFIGWSGKLVECLCKLQNIEYLYIKIFGDHQSDFCGLDAWVAPRHLYRLDIEWPCWFSTLPAWMNQSYLLDLVYLSIAVRDLGQINLETLGRLGSLRLLQLSVDPKNLGTLGGFIIGAGNS
ncbi:hypothetical protein PVAP13_8KG315004 [Panicum virgatum]|uniref:Uncharacterized protein n=1 Tax=Panicum virgatum TaxID=38727 RepID=A0A8T0PN14_PANVG|nr:hypothetical protein PVAP13_8KG315004 [Panicum virgatum]